MWLPLASPNPGLTHMVCAHLSGEKWMFCESECDQMGPAGSVGPHWSPEQCLHLCKVTFSPVCTSAPCKETSAIPVPNTIVCLILWVGRGRCSCQSCFHQK